MKFYEMHITKGMIKEADSCLTESERQRIAAEVQREIESRLFYTVAPKPPAKAQQPVMGFIDLKGKS